MKTVAQQARAVVRRHPERAAPDEVVAILAAGLVAHVGFVQDGQPFVIPMAYHYDRAERRRLYLHGALPSRLLTHLAGGAPVSIAVTLLDGFVYSRTALYHSVNYRSVVCFGHAGKTPTVKQATLVLEAMIARYHPGRTAGRDYFATPPRDIAATNLVALEIEEWSAKARRGGPKGPLDNEIGVAGSAGVIELRTVSFDVHRADVADASAIVAILSTAFAEYESLYTPAAFAATVPPRTEIERRIQQGAVWIAKQGGALIGTLSAVPREQRLYLRGLGVTPSARRMGVSRALLGHAETYARISNLHALELRTSPFLHAAIRLYEQAGFCRIGDKLDDHFGTPTFTMIKRLED